MQKKELLKVLNSIINTTENKVERYFLIGKLLLNVKNEIEIDEIARIMPSGYGKTNLNSARQFYKKFRNTEFINLVYQLSWSHVLELIKGDLETEDRFFYLKKATSSKQNQWTVDELKENIKKESYESFLSIIEKLNYEFTIEKLTIQNYKALKNIEIIKPSSFLVFAGANATGKSSIFEALEFLMHSAMTTGDFVFDIFGGKKEVLNYDIQEKNAKEAEMLIKLDLSFADNETKRIETTSFGLRYNHNSDVFVRETSGSKELDQHIVNSFSRLFIDNIKRSENKIKSPNKLWINASNLNEVLKTILKNKENKEELIEWLEIFIPEFERIEIKKDFTGQEELLIYEKRYPKKPFSGKLISEGTMNIIALITSVYQLNNAQFLCIEEPETGLNPAILSELIPFFKEMAEKKGHNIWITTHSTSIVSELTEGELSIVSKENGETKIYPTLKGVFQEMEPDKAWLSNMLKGGGLPW